MLSGSLKVRCGLSAVIGTFLCLISAVAAYGNSSACPDTQLQGTYLYAFSGFFYKTGSAVGTTGASDPFVVAGRLTLDGNGQGFAWQTTNTRKEITQATGFPLTYSVESNCMVSINLPLCSAPNCAAVAHVAFAPDGSDGLAVGGVENAVLSGQLLRVSSAGCGADTISGTYRFQTWGFGLTPNGATPTATSLAFATAGLTAASAGTLSATDWLNLGGRVLPRTLESSVSMDQNCIGTGSRQGAVGARLYASGDGSVFVLIQVIPGAPVVGWYKRQ